MDLTIIDGSKRGERLLCRGEHKVVSDQEGVWEKLDRVLGEDLSGFAGLYDNSLYEGVSRSDLQ